MLGEGCGEVEPFTVFLVGVAGVVTGALIQFLTALVQGRREERRHAAELAEARKRARRELLTPLYVELVEALRVWEEASSLNAPEPFDPVVDRQMQARVAAAFASAALHAGPPLSPWLGSSGATNMNVIYANLATDEQRSELLRAMREDLWG